MIECPINFEYLLGKAVDCDIEYSKESFIELEKHIEEDNDE